MQFHHGHQPEKSHALASVATGQFNIVEPLLKRYQQISVNSNFTTQQFKRGKI
ncbi:hypothetical protein N8639_02085 [bacterium]|nr:hypothetical protein [bacterium]